jgi:hypothetical protein
MMHDDTQAYLTTEQLAERYDLSPTTIKGWRIRKQGPTWYQVPRIGLSPTGSNPKVSPLPTDYYHAEHHCSRKHWPRS